MQEDPYQHSEIEINYPEQPKPETPKKSTSLFKSLLSIIEFFGTVSILVFIILSFGVQSYHVVGTSMTPTLQEKDRLLISKLGRTVSRIKKDDFMPSRGEIIVFKSPTESGLQLVKRVIGLPGERVVLENGKFTIYNVTYELATNNPPHHLHGGNVGFDKKIWDYRIIENSDSITILLSTESLHLEEGYPGNLKIQVFYTFDNEGRLTIEYEASSDQLTHINLTNHCYFNLSGDIGSTILDHHLQINSDSITETDDLLIPTGKIVNIKASNLDFSEMTEIGLRIKNDDPNLNKANGYDHNYVINGQINSVTAIAQHPPTGRRLQVFTTEPGLQLYTGNWLNEVNGKHGLYQNYSGFCLETQHYPDSPNQPKFPTTLLKPGETYQTTTVYKFSVK